MMRLNRVRHLINFHAEHGTGWFATPYKLNTYYPARWFVKHGLIEGRHPSRFESQIRVTEKGEESLTRAIAEHEAHGNFKRQT